MHTIVVKIMLIFGFCLWFIVREILHCCLVLLWNLEFYEVVFDSHVVDLYFINRKNLRC